MLVTFEFAYAPDAANITFESAYALLCRLDLSLNLAPLSSKIDVKLTLYFLLSSISKLGNSACFASSLF
jgi:hypothetical protein